MKKKTEGEKEKLIGVMEIAKSNELMGLGNYLKFARETKNTAAKNMFVILANDELDHFNLIEHERRALMTNARIKPVKVDTSLIAKLFPKLSDVKRGPQSETTDMDALKIALKLEENSRNFYKNEAERTTNAVIKQLFLKLAQIEDGHYKLIQAEIDSISSSGFWMDVPEFTMEE
jgi:rubrerythrin